MITNEVIIVFLIMIFVFLFAIFLRNKDKRIEKLEQIVSKQEDIITKQDNLIKQVNDKIVEINHHPKIIGFIEKYTEKDVNDLSHNLEFVDIVLKYLSFEIAMKTDWVRNTQDGISTEMKIGFLNGLHQTYSFFHKLKNRKGKKEETGLEGLV